MTAEGLKETETGEKPPKTACARHAQNTQKSYNLRTAGFVALPTPCLPRWARSAAAPVPAPRRRAP